MDIAVLGGRGYVGSAITETLREQGHDVTTMDPHIGGENHVSLDILSMEVDGYLDGYDAVVNLVGLSPMKQPGIPGYFDLHVAGAENVVGACEANGIDRLVHMSALGASSQADTAFLRTKGLGEEAVLDSDIADVTVFRPSVIFDHGNELVEYAKRFAPLRVFPNIPTPVQPIYRGDVADLFAQAVTGDIDEDVLEVGGPEKMSLFTFVQQLYNAKGYACYPAPVLPIMTLGLHVMEYVPFIPFGKEQAWYLAFDNTTDDNDAPAYTELTSYSDWLEQEV